MVLGHGPKVVTDGLVLALDAADRNSYPGSGTTWTDLSGNGNNGTLVNGVGYNGSNGGSLSFDGVDDYISFSTSSSLQFGTGNFSIDFIFKFNSITVNQYFFDFGTNNLVLQYYQSGSGYVLRYLTQTTQIKDTTYTLNTNIFYNLTVVRNSGTGYLYLNSNQISSWSDSGNYTSNSLDIFRYGGRSFYTNGNLYNFKIYNRALTSSEIRQNFNALRGRFGI